MRSPYALAERLCEMVRNRDKISYNAEHKKKYLKRLKKIIETAGI